MIPRPSGTLAIPTLGYLERYRNEGTRTYSRHADYSECLADYQPTGDRPWFELPTWRLPDGALRVYRADPPAELESAVATPEGVRFHIHPQVLAECPADPFVRRTIELGRPIRPIRAAPTASTRTLFVLDQEPTHSVKVHFPFRISRYGRRMRDEVIEQAITVSRMLQRWSPGADPDFAFLREVIGVSHPPAPRSPRDPGAATPDRGEQWGYLARDMDPYPPVHPRTGGSARKLVPAFSLYGRDAFDPATPPLLRSLAHASIAGTSDPVEWTLERILLPTIRQWIRCYRELGFILEPHGQNLLLELDENDQVTRLVHRDLSVGIDMRIRRARRLDDGALNRYNRFEDGVFASIAYDRFMGNHFFGPLLGHLLGADAEPELRRLRAHCADAFAQWFPDHRDWLPRTEHYFSEVRDAHGKPLYEDTGVAPRWRP